MKHNIILTLIIASLFAITFAGCKNKDDNSFNIFTIEDDIELGKQLSDEIAADPQTYPLLSKTQYPDAYTHLERIKNELLNAGNVFYKSAFEWEINIIENDTVLNAFSAPGGYIYVYTGIIKYLDSEDQFAGVLAHEIAHADRRHTTDQMTKTYGIQLMLDLVIGKKQELLSQIAQGLLSLKYSRNDETEADTYSVTYLCPTDYNAAGSAGFFQKIDSSGAPQTPTFLSTHPNPENRITSIYEQKQSQSCTGVETYVSRYQDFKNTLP